MKFTKKMRLVDYDGIDGHGGQVFNVASHAPYSDDYNQLTELDRCIQEILNNKNLSDTEKVKYYNELLRQFMLKKSDIKGKRKNEYEDIFGSIYDKFKDRGATPTQRQSPDDHPPPPHNEPGGGDETLPPQHNPPPTQPPPTMFPIPDQFSTPRGRFDVNVDAQGNKRKAVKAKRRTQHQSADDLPVIQRTLEKRRIIKAESDPSERVPKRHHYSRDPNATGLPYAPDYPMASQAGAKKRQAEGGWLSDALHSWFRPTTELVATKSIVHPTGRKTPLRKNPKSTQRRLSVPIDPHYPDVSSPDDNDPDYRPYTGARTTSKITKWNPLPKT